MNSEFQNKLSNYAKNRKKKRKWLTTVASLCAVVAVGTSYLLINPAATQLQETYCGFEEHKEHDDTCYEKVLACPFAEEGSMDAESGNGEQRILICPIPEMEGHTHTDQCYAAEQYLACGMEESDEHQHGEECYETELTLICEEEEVAGHHHDDSCYEQQEGNASEEEEIILHQHDEGCYETDYDHLLCEVPIHEHTLQCFSNPEADVENASVWERSFDKAELSGNWNKDVIAIARTQIGYTESTANYMVQEDGTSMNGYTRYGAWYGNAYGDWDAMFCSFCLHYAGVDEEGFPVDSDCESWMDTLQKEEYNRFRPAGEYTPAQGDLIFFDEDLDGICDNVGLVEKLDGDEKEAAVQITTIEGNSTDCVCRNKYEISDNRILGFGLISDESPVQENAGTDDERADEDIVEGTEQTETGSEMVAEPETEMRAETEPETIAEKIAAGLELITEEAMTRPEMITEEAETESEMAMETETETESEIATETETESESEMATEPESETETETESETGNGEEELIVKSVECENYIVQVQYSKDANIPDEAELRATQIPHEGDEYLNYYNQSIEAMLANGSISDGGKPAISYLEFFDIGFYLDDEEIEPEAPVDITITTREQVEIEEDEVASAIHFGENGTEVLDVNTEVPTEPEAECAFSFTQESFSITGVMVLDKKYYAVDSVSDGDQVIIASWRDSYPATFYLTTTNNAGRLQLTKDKNEAVIWTVESKNGTIRLKSGDQYLTVGSGTAGLTGNNRQSATLKSQTGYWDIQYNGQYLNEYNGHGSGIAAGWTDSGAKDDGSKWLVLKRMDSAPEPTPIPTPTGIPKTGSITGVQTDTLEIGAWYIIYGGTNGRVLDADYINQPESLKTWPTNGGTVEYVGDYDVVWEWTGIGFRNRKGQYLRAGVNDLGIGFGLYSWLGNYWLGDPSVQNDLNVVYDSYHRILYNTQNYWGIKYNKVYIHNWQNVAEAVTETSLGPVRQAAEPIYLARVTGNSSTTGGHDNHPRMSITGTPKMSDLVFYNFDTTQDPIKGKAGVEYTIYKDGEEVARYMTTDAYTVPVGKLDPGKYTIKQTAVPEGYTVVSQEREFEVSDAGTAVIGSFYDYKDTDYETDKTASVLDFIDRTYQVDLKAKQSLYDYVIDNTNFSLVVDQSNSMLFPAELTPVMTSDNEPMQVRLYRNPNGEDQRNGNALNQLGLDKNQVYYFISNPQIQSTVYALFWDGSGWVFQDSSYYAKAQNREDLCDHNIYDGDGTPKFATSGVASGTGVNANANGYIVSGGDINFSLDSIYEFKHDGQTNNWATYTLYTGSQYNRLHDLQQAVALLCNTLSSMTTNATIRLETFARNVETCNTYNLGTDGGGVAQVIEAVNNIECAGGTRQDRALNHLQGVPLDEGTDKTGHTNQNHLDPDKTEYVILITDGAPNDWGITTSTVAQVANNLKENNKNAIVVTAGLSMANVKGGSEMLQLAATTDDTNYTWCYAAEKADALSEYMTQMLFRASPNKNHDYQSTIVDEISDSFYPINPDDNKALTDGTVIGLDGKVLTGYALRQAKNDGQYGTVKYNTTTKTWYVEWNNQTLKCGDTWNGRIYLKAKEDFIGGNSIDTNKSANISLELNGKTMASTDLETPTVNVRLLEMNEVSSEETVFLGDKVSIPEKIKALYEQVKFTKLVDNGDDVHNKFNAKDTSGLDEATFTPAYAWAKNLTEEDWKKLFNGEELTLPYTYDDPSSHGPVGCFTVKLTKAGDGSSFDEHATTHTDTEDETTHETYAEKYTLKIDYTPYKLGEGDDEHKREANVHNGEKGPGDEVTEPVISTNYHYVHVVDGKVTIKKEITDKLKSDKDQTFSFRLSRQESDQFVDTGLTAQVVVSANSTNGQTVVPDLPRGTYKLEEIIEPDAEYYVKESNVVAGEYNCQQNETELNSWTFTIGNDTDGNDIIVPVSGDGYRPVYSELKGGFSGIKGVSYETVWLLNDKTIYYAEIPVDKVWNQVNVDNYKDKQVYVALYKDNEPVKDDNDHVLALLLNNGNEWKGKFTVALPDKDAQVSEQGFVVRELDDVSNSQGSKPLSAIVVNISADEPVIVYYEKAIEEGIVHNEASVYDVEISMEEKDEGYSATVTNNAIFYELPDTGGIGTYHLYTLGAVLMAGSLMFTCKLRRKQEQ